MTDYSKLSNEEINKRVHALEINRLIKKLEEAGKHELIELMKLDNDIAYSNSPPDYCNSWGIMGPIIEREKIELTFDGGFTELWSSCHIKHLPDGMSVNTIGFNEHKKPMRAAATTYLKKYEGRNNGLA